MLLYLTSTISDNNTLEFIENNNPLMLYGHFDFFRTKLICFCIKFKQPEKIIH